MSAEREVHEVDPARLAPGRWDHGSETDAGEGDIAASYSADRIASDGAVRRPFRWNGGSYVSTGSFGPSGRIVHEAYRLVEVEAFDGTPTTYGEKTLDCEAARNDPLGFYHGMAVRQGGKTLILCGPPVRFVAGAEVQASLFAGLDRGHGR